MRPLQAHIAAVYQLPLHAGRFLIRGVSDTSLFESKDAKYILKIYRAAHRTQPEISGEVELLTHLHALRGPTRCRPHAAEARLPRGPRPPHGSRYHRLHGYCHYDFLPKNFRFDAQNRLTFFDFDFAGSCYLVNDVMVFFMHYFLHTITKRLPSAEATRDFQLFLASYCQVRPLSEDELAAIPALGFAF